MEHYRVPENPLIQLIGQNRAPNTIKLRNAYSKYRIKAEEDGEDILEFGIWAKKNYPDMKILEQ